MEKLGLNVIREKYLSFFESKGHLRMPSFSLVPKNDPSLLLINAGMAPLKPYFTGAEIPPRRRVTTCQKCIRTPDIDNVGKTARHGTFFEMLGNFSFGDYFKKEAIAWAWEFLTQVMEIPKDRLWVTIYKDDDEAFDIWHNQEHVPAERIVRMGKEDNFWEHGTGPCGPCSEIHFDRGEKYGCGKPTCGVGCDCDRYIEVWNLVFTQFDRQEDGSYARLKNANIDTGMGLERLACVMQGVDNLFEVDTVRKILDTVCAWSGKTYGADWATDVSIRVITDHIRSTVMMIGDGVVPSNEGRGYVLRRLLRGAARHGRKLGIRKCFLSELADVVVELSGGAYPEIAEKQDYIKKVIRIEEERFDMTLEQGMNLLSSAMNEIKAAAAPGETPVLAGKTAFRLHDTYGFPLDLTRDILRENGMEVDEAGFRAEMNNQRAKARDAIKDRESSWAAGEQLVIPKDCKATVFDGYDALAEKAKLVYILKEDGTQMPALEEGDRAVIITDRTVFYGESGGQAGDKGTITTDTGVFTVLNTTKSKDGVFRHIGECTQGSLEAGDTAELKVDRRARLATARNHSATHLLQKALRIVLGDHVHQAGSSVNADRLRFDFNHLQAMTPDEIARTEALVNDAIYEDYDVVTDLMDLDAARKSGATALFDEKYGDVVRVVSMGDYSKELCGGTHVKNTASVGLFKILHESAVAAGVRRIEAVTGEQARKLFLEEEAALSDTAEVLKAARAEVPAKARQLTDQYKSAVKELETAKMASAKADSDRLIDAAPVVKGVKVVSGRFDALDADGLRELCEQLRSKAGESVVLLASGLGGKVTIAAMCTPEAVKAGINCGKLVKACASMCQGGGGGRPDMAQAGGKDVTKIDEMLGKVPELV
ncbi:MAG: alanine--tRNA ligase [Clostridia bacterium]|nr:alanine--tRNA ligase [Clostridia bacterium]